MPLDRGAGVVSGFGPHGLASDAEEEITKDLAAGFLLRPTADATSVGGCFRGFIALLLATLSAGVAIVANGAEQRPVSMTLQSVSLTNGPWQTDHWHFAVFVVTNGGPKAVHLNCCAASFIPTNIPMPLGVFGSCAVPAFTNSILSVQWKPSHPGTQWFRYAVFEQPYVIWKATTTARAAEDAALGKGRPPNGWLSSVWSTNGWRAAYEITSPPFEALPEPLFPAGSALVNPHSP